MLLSRLLVKNVKIWIPSRLHVLESVFLTIFPVFGVYIKIWDVATWDAYKGQVV